MWTTERLEAVIKRMSARAERRRAKAVAAGVDPWTDPIFRDSLYQLDRLGMVWNAAVSSGARRSMNESRQLAREDLDLPNASEQELDDAIQRRLK